MQPKPLRLVLVVLVMLPMSGAAHAASPRIASPGTDALVARAPVRLVVGGLAGLRAVQLAVNDRTVRAPVRRGALLLTRAGGLRFGRNQVVLSARRDGQPVVVARTFCVVRPVQGLEERSEDKANLSWVERCYAATSPLGRQASLTEG